MTPEHERQLVEFTNKVQVCTARLEEHLNDNDNHVKGVREELTKMKDNHLAHIQASMAQIEISVTRVATNQEWLMKTYWVVASTAIGGLITALFALL